MSEYRDLISNCPYSPYLDENLDRYEDALPKYIGNFGVQGQRLMAYVPIPDDAFDLVVQNVAANKIKFMTLRGEKLRYRRGRIYEYSLKERQDDESS